MKITKSELKEMIREALREELSKYTSLKENVWSCYFDNRYVGTVEAPSEYEAKVKMMDEYPEYPYSLYDGCFWVEPEDESSLKESHNTNEPGYYADSIFAILDDLSNDEIYTFLGEYSRYRVLEGECISDLYTNINSRYFDNYSGYQLYSDLCNFFNVTEIHDDGTIVRD
jgi:hypothetical protein